MVPDICEVTCHMEAKEMCAKSFRGERLLKYGICDPQNS